jgi:hypothetical protein
MEGGANAGNAVPDCAAARLHPGYNEFQICDTHLQQISDL